MSKRGIYRVKFQERNGRDGGFGKTRSFKTSASNPHSAGRKKRKRNARIVSVRLVKKL